MGKVNTEKVYCKDCEYYKDTCGSIWCDVLEYVYTTNTYYEPPRKYKTHLDPRIKNRNNDCKDYKR